MRFKVESTVNWSQSVSPIALSTINSIIFTFKLRYISQVDVSDFNGYHISSLDSLLGENVISFKARVYRLTEKSHAGTCSSKNYFISSHFHQSDLHTERAKLISLVILKASKHPRLVSWSTFMRMPWMYKNIFTSVLHCIGDCGMRQRD